MSSAASSSGLSAKSVPPSDAITRNALRYTISVREYELLHRYLLSRASAVKKRAPAPQSHPANSDDDYNAASVRITLRLFLSSYAGLKLWEQIAQRFLGRAAEAPGKVKTSLWKNSNFRLSLSLSSIIFFHRTLHRFFLRLRASLLTDEAQPFRRRNPRIARLLTSRISPAVGAAVSGFALGLSPADQTRLTITIYILSRAVEYAYNHLEDRGWFSNRPQWLGSWLLMPLAAGQLLHAFVFDRDCFPASYGNFIMKRSPAYIQTRPADYPVHLPWPNNMDIVDALANISQARWPSFSSPILFPNHKALPTAAGVLSKIAPITDPANPAIHQLSCAVLHPSDPSCLRTYLTYYLRAFPTMARFWAVIYAAFSLPRYKAFMSNPVASFNALAKRILRTSFYLTSAIGTAWGSICLLQHLLPRSVLPTSRWFVSGFMAGCWAFLERGHGRSDFIYSARASADSVWKVGKKKGWWKGVRNGDVMLFVAALATVNAVYERNPKAVTGGVVRKALGVARGEGWVDRATEVTTPSSKETKTQ